MIPNKADASLDNSINAMIKKTKLVARAMIKADLLISSIYFHRPQETSKIIELSPLNHHLSSVVNVAAGLNIWRERCFATNSKVMQKAVNLVDLILRSLDTGASS